jgi:anaphase-promoting complex subunit 8
LAESDEDDGQVLGQDSPSARSERRISPQASKHQSPTSRRETQLEAREAHKFLLAKTYFNCREFDRCAAVFLPSTVPTGPFTESQDVPQTPRKGKAKARTSSQKSAGSSSLPELSQKSLFLALYAKYMSGEKVKDEESEMILGPSDGGVTVNRELAGISRMLEEWFFRHTDPAESQGWLEYLFGVVLAKGKNEDDAKRFLLQSVHKYPYNWAAWEELAHLIGSAKEVCMACHQRDIESRH